MMKGVMGQHNVIAMYWTMHLSTPIKVLQLLLINGLIINLTVVDLGYKRSSDGLWSTVIGQIRAYHSLQDLPMFILNLKV